MFKPVSVDVYKRPRIADLTLCAEGLARTGRAQNQNVGVLQLLAIHHDMITSY